MMQILALGAIKFRQSQRAFSLLEVMVVLVILGIITATISITMVGGSRNKALREEAQRLAVLFAIAENVARSRNQIIVWEYDKTGYAFRARPRQLRSFVGTTRELGMDKVLTNDDSLRPRVWAGQASIQVHIEPAGECLFDGEWIHGPMTVKLSDGTAEAYVIRSGSGRYDVVL